MLFLPLRITWASITAVWEWTGNLPPLTPTHPRCAIPPWNNRVVVRCAHFLKTPRTQWWEVWEPSLRPWWEVLEAASSIRNMWLKKKKKSPLHLRLKVEWRFYFFLIFPNWLTRETLKLSVSSLIKTSLFCKEMCFTFAKTLFVQLALLCPLDGFRPARNHDRSFFLFFKFLFWNDKPEIKRQFYYNPKTIAWFLSPFLSPSYTQVSALNKRVKSPNHSGSVC